MFNFKNKTNFSYYIGEHFNNALFNMKLPFFFDGDSPYFYRFEGLTYNSRYDREFRNFTLNLDISLKVKTRFLISMFFNIPKTELLNNFEYDFSNYFLLNNSFLKLNLLSDSKILNSNLNTHFLKSSLSISIANLYGISYDLSDISLDVLASYNKFNRIVSSNFPEIDTFISGFNAN